MTKTESCIHVPELLNLLNVLGEIDKMLGKALNPIFYPNSFNQSIIGPVSLTWVLRICYNQRLLRKRSLKILNLIELDQGQWMTLTFGTHKASCTHFSFLHLPTFISEYNSFWKIHCFNFFLYGGIQDQIWSCHKIGHVQPYRSWSTLGHHLNKLGSTRVPDAEYQVPRSSAFRFQTRRFLKDFTIYGHSAHLGHVT